MRSLTRLSFAILMAFVLNVCFSSTQAALAQSGIIISEFRFDGPNGPDDEFVELVNNTGSPIPITSTDNGGQGGFSVWGLAAGVAQQICEIPNGTVLKPGQHFLCARNPGFGMSGYSQGVDDNIATAVGLDTDGGVALFSSSTMMISGGVATSKFTGPVLRLDAVGFFGVGVPVSHPFPACVSFFNPEQQILRENPPLSPIGPQDPASRLPRTPNDLREYSFVRKHITDAGGTWSGATYQDTNNNAADFTLVSNVGDLFVTPAFVSSAAINTSFPGTPFNPGSSVCNQPTTPVFGAPGPQSLKSPIERNRNTQFTQSLFDPFGLPFLAPNAERSLIPACGGPQGTLILRFTYKNQTGSTQKFLRVRWTDLSTINRTSSLATAVLVSLDSTAPFKTLFVNNGRDSSFNDPLSGSGSPPGDGIVNNLPAGGAGVKTARGTYVEGVDLNPQVLTYFPSSSPPGFGNPPGFPFIQLFRRVNPLWFDGNTSCRVGGFNSAKVVTKPNPAGMTTTQLPIPMLKDWSISLEHRFGVIKGGQFFIVGIVESN
jgi:hypothetical protein